MNDLLATAEMSAKRSTLVACFPFWSARDALWEERQRSRILNFSCRLAAIFSGDCKKYGLIVRRERFRPIAETQGTFCVQLDG